jgi:alanine racemase
MRPTWAEINLQALDENVKSVKSMLPVGVRLNAVIKADAYGHGAQQIAHTALTAGADSLSVATLEEAVELRMSGIWGPILVLGFIPPDAAWQVARSEITATVFTPELAKALQEAGAASQKIIKVHLKLDTGMSRIGVEGTDDDVDFTKQISEYANLELEGLFSHFAMAEIADPKPALEQLAKFQSFADRVERAGVKIPVLHMANTAAIFRFPQSYYNMVRLGVGMYGSSPTSLIIPQVPLRPVMTLKTRIIMLKKIKAGTRVGYDGTWIAPVDSVLGTLPLGYADGMSRSYSNRAQVCVRGCLAPVVGRVCMDQCMIDLTQVPGAEVGDEVILFGESTPDRNALRLAEEIGEIPHQIMASVSKRVPRFYNDRS